MTYHPALGNLRGQLTRIAVIAAMLAASLTLIGLDTQRASLPSERWYRLARQQVMEADLAWHLGDALDRVGRAEGLSLEDWPWLLRERAVAVWERRTLSSQPSHAAAWRLGVVYGHRGYGEHAADMLTLAASLDEVTGDYYHALAELYSNPELSDAGLRSKAAVIAGHEGWLTDIALADCFERLGEDARLTDVRRRQQARSVRFIGGFAAVCGIAGLLGVIGLVTIVVLLLRWGLTLRTPRARLPFMVPWTVIDVAEAIAVLLFAMVMGGLLAPLLLGSEDASQPSVTRALVIALQYVLVSGVTIGVIVFRLRGRASRPLQILGLRLRRLVGLMGTGVAGYAVFVAAAMLLAVLAGSLFGGTPMLQTTEQIVGTASSPAEVAVFFVLVCVLAPVIEEIIFRGYVYGGLRRVLPSRQAIIIGGALFAAVHLNAEAFLVIGLIGAMLCYLYERTRSLVPGMVAHGIHNGLVLAVMLLQSV